MCDTHQNWSIQLSEVSAACDIAKPWKQKQTNPPTLIEELSIHLYDIAAWYQDRKVVYLKYHSWYTSKLINTTLWGQCRVQHRKAMKAKANKSSNPYRKVIHPSIWRSCMVPRQKSSIAQISCVIHIKIDQYPSLRSVPRATSKSHESKNKQILQPLSKSYPSIYMTQLRVTTKKLTNPPTIVLSFAVVRGWWSAIVLSFPVVRGWWPAIV